MRCPAVFVRVKHTCNILKKMSWHILILLSRFMKVYNTMCQFVNIQGIGSHALVITVTRLYIREGPSNPPSPHLVRVRVQYSYCTGTEKAETYSTKGKKRHIGTVRSGTARVPYCTACKFIDMYVTRYERNVTPTQLDATSRNPALIQVTPPQIDSSSIQMYIYLNGIQPHPPVGYEYKS